MTDDLFHIVDDAQIILRRKGVFKQAKLFCRSGKLYAAWGGGFIRLLASGGTSCPDVSWESLPDHPSIARTSLEIRFMAPKDVPKVLEHAGGKS